MKKLLIGALVLVLVGALGVNAKAATAKDVSNGTVTIRQDLDLASAAVTGADHGSAAAVKTAWVAVPVGIPFSIYVETDVDSNAAWSGADTMHVGLETTPMLSLAASGGSSYNHRAVLLWNAGGINHAMWAGGGGEQTIARSTAATDGPQAHYFQWAPGDTIADTLGMGAALSAAPGVGGAAKVQNMGLLRFSLAMADNDTTADAAFGFRCYIIYRQDQYKSGSGDSHSSVGHPSDLYWTAVEPGYYEGYRSWAVKEKH